MFVCYIIRTVFYYLYHSIITYYPMVLLVWGPTAGITVVNNNSILLLRNILFIKWLHTRLL